MVLREINLNAVHVTVLLASQFTRRIVIKLWFSVTGAPAVTKLQVMLGVTRWSYRSSYICIQMNVEYICVDVLKQSLNARSFKEVLQIPFAALSVTPSFYCE